MANFLKKFSKIRVGFASPFFFGRQVAKIRHKKTNPGSITCAKLDKIENHKSTRDFYH
jgi:hypothetical protein